jgi:hypothetical protein
MSWTLLAPRPGWWAGQLGPQGCIWFHRSATQDVHKQQQCQGDTPCPGGGAFGLLCSACTLTTLAACAACNCLSPSYHLTHEPSRISTGHALTGHAATPVDTFSKALTKGTGRVLNEVDECHCGVCSDYRFSRSRMMHTAVKDEKSTAVSVEVRGPAWSAACRWCEALHGQRVGARHCMVSWGAGDTSLPATLL